MSSFDWKEPRDVEAALARGLVTITFQKEQAKPGEGSNECYICKKALWSNPDPQILSMSEESRPYGYANDWQAANDGVAHLACNHHVHEECFQQYGKDPEHQRPSSNPMVSMNLACPKCGHGCSMWSATMPNENFRRIMTCTRNLSLVPMNDQPKDLSKHNLATGENTVRAYAILFSEIGDVNFVGWKSFRMDTLVGAEPRNEHLAAYVESARD